MPSVSEIINNEYGKLVRNKYPQKEYSWPILSGCDILNGEYCDYIICIFKHTGNRSVKSTSVIKFDGLSLDHIIINEKNIDSVREKIRNDFHLSNMDSVVILSVHGTNLQSELIKLLEAHEVVMGVIKMKVFLSHKGADKARIRLYKRTLESLGFDVWLDEDDMPAGTALHRGILQGFKDSCAAIFFITPNYVDEGFLETEVNYAISEKMRRGCKFSIITLVFEDEGIKGQVPELLKSYVWKTPSNDLEALQEILKALPIKLGGPQYR
jgi:hypothetical protein